MYKDKIGIIGGFGAYATQGFIDKLLIAFKGETERDYPHIICDNNYTMPSRTRALLYGDSYNEIVSEIAHSLKVMLDLDVEHIILVCGTAHYFLTDVYKILPNAKDRVINIIECLGRNLQSNNVDKVLIIAAEGALKKKLYCNYLSTFGIETIEPEDKFYDEIRYFIECVKKKEFDDIDLLATRFCSFISYFNCNDVVLGCTEFPVLINTIGEKKIRKMTNMNIKFHNPLDIAITFLKDIIK